MPLVSSKHMIAGNPGSSTGLGANGMVAAENQPMTKVLLIEDDSETAEEIAAELADRGFEVEWSANGIEGLDKARSSRPDAMIVDRLLPGMDGLTVVEALRKEQVRTPVLVLSALGAVDDRVRGLRMGGDDYLTKPFALAELLVRVKALLRRGPVNRASSLRIGDLELDRISQQVKRGGRRIELTGKEYSLLEYLMANAGRVLSRSMIIEHVWDQSFDGASGIVDVYLGRLRSKIDQPYEQKLIRTVRGVGYSISNGDS